MAGVASGTSQGVFVEATRNALQDVLSQALSPDWRVQVAAEGTAALEIGTSAFFGLLVTGTISGKAGLLLSQANAALIARAFVGEPPQETADFSDEQREAFEELLRQVFGLATTALKDRFDQVWIEIDRAVPVAEPSRRITLLATSDSGPSTVAFELWMSSELADSLLVADQAPSAPDGLAPCPVTSDAQSQDRPSDLSVLAGVEVEITLRFGHRRLPLRGIAALSPGSVVELDESVAEPVEVVVGDRVMARGEIVSVDGCYGIRITETSDHLAEAAAGRPQP